MSTREKSRTVGHAWPSRAVPTEGTLSFPAAMALCAAAKNAAPLQSANCPNMLLFNPLTHRPCWRLLVPLAAIRVRLGPLKPNHNPTVEPAGTLATAGVAAALVPRSITSGLYRVMLPLASMIAPCTYADWFGLASLHGPWPAFVAVSWYGVARPAADSGLAGTINVQFGLGCAAALPFWIRAMAPTATNTPATTPPTTRVRRYHRSLVRGPRRLLFEVCSSRRDSNDARRIDGLSPRANSLDGE